MIYAAIQQLIHTLNAFHGVLNKAEAFATDHAELLSARLAPDMLHLVRQVQIASDTAKFAAARLAGQDAPPFEDNEASFTDLHARLQKTIDYLQSFSADAFNGASDRKIILPYNKEAFLTSSDYLFQFVIPNFYFHISTAYGILRHRGVEIGKMDYLGPVNFQPLNS